MEMFIDFSSYSSLLWFVLPPSTVQLKGFSMKDECLHQPLLICVWWFYLTWKGFSSCPNFEGLSVTAGDSTITSSSATTCLLFLWWSTKLWWNVRELEKFVGIFTPGNSLTAKTFLWWRNCFSLSIRFIFKHLQTRKHENFTFCWLDF